MTRITWTCRCGAQRVEHLKQHQIRGNRTYPHMPGWTRGGPRNEPKCPGCTAGLTPIYRQLCEELGITIVKSAA
jgi:hypothetical protein